MGSALCGPHPHRAVPCPHQANPCSHLLWEHNLTLLLYLGDEFKEGSEAGAPFFIWERPEPLQHIALTVRERDELIGWPALLHMLLQGRSCKSIGKKGHHWHPQGLCQPL